MIIVINIILKTDLIHRYVRLGCLFLNMFKALGRIGTGGLMML